MNPLEAFMRPATAVINRQIRLITPARELCAELAGSVIAVQVVNTGMAIYFEVQSDSIRLRSEYDDEPDAIISGSLLSLASLTAGETAIRKGDVDLRGDADVARSFRRLLQLAKPDLEEELSTVIGDAPAHAIGQLARRVGSWGRDAKDTMLQNVTEYLQEESRTLPSRNEVNAFRDDVNVLRDDAARLEARLRNLEAKTASE